MKTEPKTLAGFMELYPKEQIAFDNIKNTIIETYKSYGFYPLDTPVIEYSEVLLAKAGGETEKQIYRFEKGDNDLSLRFDLTVPLAKYVAKRSNELVFPFKRFQTGKVFRGERPQKGRFREFYQCDIDVIGEEDLSLKYDSEVVNVIYDIFRKLNFGPFVIRINNRKILGGFFESLGLSDKVSDILRTVDKIDKIGIEEVKKELSNLGVDNDRINKIIEFISLSGTSEEKLRILKNNYCDNELFKKGVEELDAVINDLELRKIPNQFFEVDLTIARGLDYYTGSVYETKLVNYPGIGSVCSGGRYDNLAEYYTDKKLPGVGASIGLTRLFSKLMETGLVKIESKSSIDVMILPMCDRYDYIYKVNNLLKENNIKCSICYLDKGFKQKMKYANKIGCKYIIIIGEDEVKNNIVTLKNMVDGNQLEINIDEINSIIKILEG